MNVDWAKSRQAKSGLFMVVYVLVAIAILGAVNYLAVQYNKNYDATKNKLYSLSDQTVRVLSNLDRDVKIYYFDKKLQFNRAKDMLVRYENASNKVKVEYIDPDSKPDMAQAMNVRTYGTVLVDLGSGRQEAKSTNEEDITNAIIRAVKGKEKKACLLAGHGEASPESQERDGFSGAKSEIEGANYTIETISLLEHPQIPSDCTLLIIAGPNTEYLEPEIAILRKFVESGGAVLFMIDYQKSPALVGLLASWGIKVNDDIVVDPSGIGQLMGGGPLTPLVAQYEDHPISKAMGNVTTFFPLTRSVEPGESPAGWTASKLFNTMSDSFATEQQPKGGELTRNPDKERKGPISVGVAASYKVPESAPASTPDAAAASKEPGAAETPAGAEAKKEPLAAAKKEGRIVVLGTSRLARNNYLGLGGNSDLLLNALNWLSSDEDLMSIRPKQPDSTPLDATESEMRRLFLGTVLGLPLVIIITGIRVWWTRRS